MLSEFGHKKVIDRYENEKHSQHQGSCSEYVHFSCWSSASCSRKIVAHGYLGTDDLLSISFPEHVATFSFNMNDRFAIKMFAKLVYARSSQCSVDSGC